MTSKVAGRRRAAGLHGAPTAALALTAALLVSCGGGEAAQAPAPTQKPTTSTTATTVPDATTAPTSTSVQPSQTSSSPTTMAAPPGRSAINVEPNTVQRGHEVQVSGSGFCPRLRLRFIIEPEGGAHESPVIGDAVTDGQGGFKTAAVIPADLEPGRYQVGAIHQRVGGREECLHRTGSEVIEVTA